ncbi:unnamed protein product [Sphagnum troendelagicum]|uniref:Uncharacterized protein n=1 Tax=Sphagnum troendelagicum TaxID=128251 RepID=A0ABP0UTK1_9BRYO
MGKEKFLANVRLAAADVQEGEQSRFTGRTIKSKKHLRGPIVREEASLERGLPQLEDSSIIPAKGNDVNATFSSVSQVVQARTDAVIRGGGEQSHAGLFNLCLVILIAVNSRLIIENLMKVFLHNSLLPISAYKDILV